MKRKPLKKASTKKASKNEKRNSPKKSHSKSRPKPDRKNTKVSSPKGKSRTKQNKKSLKVVSRKIHRNTGRKGAKTISKRITANVSRVRKQKSNRKKALQTAKFEKQITTKKTYTTFNATGNPETLADRVLNNPLVDKRLTYQIKKNKKEPKAVVVIVKVKTAEGVTKTFSVISAPDFVVNLKNTKGFYKSIVSDAQGEFENFYGGGDGDPEGFKVLESTLKFIY